MSAAIVLALGSNLGDRASTLRAAVREIGEIAGLTELRASSAYESAALKPDGIDADAPEYLNAVITARYPGTPETLLDAVNAIESEHGRERAQRWGDRTLDIDIIVFGTLERTDARLTLPHPRAFTRDFVLAPWLELDPEALLPGHGRVAELLVSTGNTLRLSVGIGEGHR